MKAKDISGLAPGGERTKLSEQIPLTTPFVVQVFPIYACCFKCNYCIFNTKKAERGFISDKVLMDMKLYQKFINDLKQFPNKLKVLRFVGIGEPLLHKDIIEMIHLAKKEEVADTVEIITNGYLLNNEMSDKLIDARLDRLTVSLQGINATKYKEICDVTINFEGFVNNLKYFYEHKTNTKVYFKIIDVSLDTPKDKEMFYTIFGNICDDIAIEFMVPIHDHVEYSEETKSKTMTQFGIPIEDVEICPQPFYHAQINPDGKVVPCYSFEYPCILGDCNKESFVAIWNGEKFKQFRTDMLVGLKNNNEICRKCTIIKYRLFPEDKITPNDAKLILERDK